MSNRRKVLLLLLGAIILGALALFVLAPPPPVKPLPVPNGYETLVRAGTMVPTDVSDYDRMDPEQLTALVADCTNALQLARIGLTQECQVTLQFSVALLKRHVADLVNLRLLKTAFLAEGRLAELDNRARDAARSYLDLVTTGSQATRGGMNIDAQIAATIEASGVDRLQALGSRLDAMAAREIAAALETCDGNRATWAEVLEQEHTWGRRTFGLIEYRWNQLVALWSSKKVIRQSEQRFKEGQLKTRRAMIDFAARAYELDKGHPPKGVADLVPDYLKGIPQDPVGGTNMVYLPF